MFKQSQRTQTTFYPPIVSPAPTMSAPSRYETRSQTPPPPARSGNPAATLPPNASQKAAAQIPDSQSPQNNQPDTPVTLDSVERFLAVEANKRNPAFRLVQYLLARSRQPAAASQLQVLEKGLATLAHKVDSLTKSNPQRSCAAAAARASNLTQAAPPALAALRQNQAHRESIVSAKSITAEVAEMTSIQLVRAINTQQGRDTAKAARRLGAIGGSNRWALSQCHGPAAC